MRRTNILVYGLVAFLIYAGSVLASPFVADRTVDFGSDGLDVAFLSGVTSGGGDGGGETPDCSSSGVTEIDECTVWLLQPTGVSGNTEFTDTGGGPNCPHTITGGESYETTAQKKFGSTSIFVHLSQNPNVPKSAAHEDFNFGSGDFTIDGWVYTTGNGEQNILGNLEDGAPGWTDALGGFTFGISGGPPHYYRFRYDYDGVNLRDIQSTQVQVNNAWVHLAVVRSGVTFTIYYNGTAVANEAHSDTIQDTTDELGITWLAGYVDQLRVSKGIARWTSNFTPPTGPYE